MSLNQLDEAVQMLKDGYDLQLGDGIFSYMGLLKKWLLKKGPKRILEWGPGLSTVLMATLLPQCEIVTVEHDMEWFMFWTRHFQEFRNVKMYPLKLEGNYVEAPLGMGKFDLVFVDGYDGKNEDGDESTRPPCLEVAAQVLNPDGVVLIHDSERKWFWPVIDRFFTVVDESEGKWNSHTVALELKKHE